jgi:hypothetical protein
MSSFFDELEGQLHDAARTQARAGRIARLPGRWLGNLGQTVLIVVSVGITVGIAVIAGLVISHGHSAPGGPAGGVSWPPTRQELRYLRAADRRARNSPACIHDRSQPRHELPATTTGAPSEALLGPVGVLDRPATRQDVLPGRGRGFVFGEARSVYIRYVRRAQVAGGVSYYVIPVTSAYYQGRSRRPSAGCIQAIHISVRRYLPHIPRPLRARILALEDRALARAQRVQKDAHMPGVCLAWTSQSQGGGISCGDTASELRHWGLIAFDRSAGIVPNGVATVTLHYPASNGGPARTSTAKVIGNVFVTNLCPRAGGFSASMTWRSGDGTIIKSIPAVRNVDGPPNYGASNGPLRTRTCHGPAGRYERTKGA